MNISVVPAIINNASAFVCGVLVLVGVGYGSWRMRDNIAFADLWARQWKVREWRRHTGGLENLGSWASEGLPPPEKELCDYYLRHIAGVRPRNFDNAMNYLAITHQSSTTPFAFWARLILFILTAAEATTTGAFVAPFISRFATGNQITVLGYLGAFILAIMLLGLTHASGSQMRRRVAIKNNIGPYAASESGFYERTITSGMEQELDQDKTAKIRFANRVLMGAHDRGKIVASVSTSILLSFLLVAIFMGRVWENNWVATKATMDQASPVCAQGGSAPASPTDPFASMNGAAHARHDSGGSIPGFGPGVTAPPDVSCASHTAQRKGMDEGTYDQLLAGDAAAFILAIIYLLTQAMGFYFAYRHSFYGDGANAFRTTRGEPSYSSFETRYIVPGLTRASALLTVLRSELMRRVEQYGRHPSSMTMQQYYCKTILASQTSGDAVRLAVTPNIPAPSSALPPPVTPAQHTVSNGYAPTSSSSAMSNDLYAAAVRRILAAQGEQEKLNILTAASGGDATAETRIIALAHALKEDNARETGRREMLKGL